MNIDRFKTINGWADDRLMHAHDLIWLVGQDNKVLALDARFKAVLAEVEYLSLAIANARAERAAALDNQENAE